MIELKSCNICPRNCKVNRNENKLGFCNMTAKIKVARIALHYWEEPPISGTNGSGAIFFSGCNLKCIFCQNYQISTNNLGKIISIEELANEMLRLQKMNAHNINLITPTHYIPQIKDAIILAKRKGLNIPIIYNSSAYEKVESLKMLDGYIDIYLPDLKYYDNNLAIKYSKAPNYFDIANKAIKEMYRQVGTPIFSKDGIMKKGIIIRHLLLPNNIEDSKKILKHLIETYHDNVFISIMNQYTPLEQVKDIKELNRTVTKKEYNELIEYACKININNAFIQEDGSATKDLIPEFDLVEKENI